MADIMRVSDLIAALQGLPPDALVAMAADGGTGYVEMVSQPEDDPIIEDATTVTLYDWVNIPNRNETPQ